MRPPLDKRKSIRYNALGQVFALRNTIRWRSLLFFTRGVLAPLEYLERSGAYEIFKSTLLSAVVTYEALFAFAMLIVSIVGLCIRKR